MATEFDRRNEIAAKLVPDVRFCDKKDVEAAAKEVEKQTTTGRRKVG